MCGGLIVAVENFYGLPLTADFVESGLICVLNIGPTPDPVSVFPEQKMTYSLLWGDTEQRLNYTGCSAHARQS